MTPEEQQQVNAAYEANRAEALSAQRNEHANKEAHWFAQYMAAQERIKQLEAKVKELTPSESTPAGKPIGEHLEAVK